MNNFPWGYAFKGESQPTGCCPDCKGTGAANDELTGGRHWDCYGTGHLHPLDEPCPDVEGQLNGFEGPHGEDLR